MTIEFSYDYEYFNILYIIKIFIVIFIESIFSIIQYLKNKNSIIKNHKMI